MESTNEEAVESAGFAVSGWLGAMIEAFSDDTSWLFMYLIGALGVVAFSIMIERIYTILFIYESNGSTLMQRVQKLILDNNIDEAIKLTNKKKQAALYHVFKAALLNADRPFDEIQDHVEVAVLSVMPKLQKRLPYLFTIANVATLLGLLGTVAGLLETFGSLGEMEASQKQIALSRGVGTALTATAFGLVVAIPSMFCYGFLISRITSIVDEIEHYSARLLMMLRTGGQFFDNFNNDQMISTEQRPKKRRGGQSDKSDIKFVDRTGRRDRNGGEDAA